MELFYATKSNLTFEQLRLLRLGGVRSIQPGIESFSSQVLRLMRKGCTGVQNIQLLRWCEELGISVCWNILYGFPGEPPCEYKRMAELVPLLTHLQPPAFCESARMDRFSPMFAAPERFGLARRRPIPGYSYVYPLKDPDLEKLAYFFDFDYVYGRQPGNYVTDLIREVEVWATLRRQHRTQLDLFQAGSVVLINDTRPCAVKRTHVLSGVAAKIYLALRYFPDCREPCHEVRRRRQRARSLRSPGRVFGCEIDDRVGRSLPEPRCHAQSGPFR